MFIHLIAFSLEVEIVNATTGKPVEHAKAYIVSIDPQTGQIELLDSMDVEGGRITYEIDTTKVRFVGIQVVYKGFSFFSDMVNLQSTNRASVDVYEITNNHEGKYSFSAYEGFVMSSDTLIIVSERIDINVQGDSAIYPEGYILSVDLPENFSNLQFQGLPTDSYKVVGNTLQIKPFLSPGNRNPIVFVYTTNGNLNLERNFGNIPYNLIVRKDLKHSVEGLALVDTTLMGSIVLNVYRGNSPFKLKASSSQPGILERLNLKYVLAGVFAVVLIAVLLILERRRKQTASSEGKDT